MSHRSIHSVQTSGNETFVSPLGLKGIAKLAAESHLSNAKNDVLYFSLNAKTILNRCSNPSMPFQWTINPYRGCEFGCKYCYARYTHEFMELRDPDDFERKIYAKARAGEIIRRELAVEKLSGAEVAIGTATDPYQPAERQFKITRSILESISRLRGIRCSITTKSDLVLRDLDLLQAIARHNVIRVNFSITTTQARLARILEPRAPRPDIRFRAIRRLVDNRISAGVFLMPLLPGITTPVKNIEAVVKSAIAARARYLAAGVVFLMPSAQVHFFPLLKENFPSLAQRYREVFRKSAYLPAEYKNRVLENVRQLRQKHGMPALSEIAEDQKNSYEEIACQLELGFDEGLKPMKEPAHGERSQLLTKTL